MSRSRKAQRGSSSSYRADGRRGDDGHGGALTSASKLPHNDTTGHVGRLFDGCSLKCLSVSESLLPAGLQVVPVSLELFAVSAATFDFKVCRCRRWRHLRLPEMVIGAACGRGTGRVLLCLLVLALVLLLLLLPSLPLLQSRRSSYCASCVCRFRS